MGHARGVIYLAARQLDVALLALAPAEVKRAVTGNGAAGKGQVQRGVQTLLGLAGAAAALARGRRARPRRHRPGPRHRPAARRAAAPRGSAVIASLRGRLRREVRGPRDPGGGGRGLRGVPAPGHPAGAERRGRRRRGTRATEVALAIHYHATQNQPRPVLIGFTTELDKEFFEKLITVKDVGPLVAARSLSAPVGEIASAIARQDEPYLRRLPGIGPQKAKNIVAQLHGKVAKFALLEPVPATPRRGRRRAGRRRGPARHGLRGAGQAARPPAERGRRAHRRRPAPPQRHRRRPEDSSTRSTAPARARSAT